MKWKRFFFLLIFMISRLTRTRKGPCDGGPVTACFFISSWPAQSEGTGRPSHILISILFKWACRGKAAYWPSGLATANFVNKARPLENTDAIRTAPLLLFAGLFFSGKLDPPPCFFLCGHHMKVDLLTGFCQGHQLNPLFSPFKCIFKPCLLLFNCPQ